MTHKLCIQLEPKVISAREFKPFGEVIYHQGVNQKSITSVPFEPTQYDVNYMMTVNRLRKHMEGPLIADKFERHPHSAQTFIPLTTGRFLVVVAFSDNNSLLDLTTLQAFIIKSGQGISYRPGIWHFAFTSLDFEADVAVILGRTGRNDDTEYSLIEREVKVIFT